MNWLKPDRTAPTDTARRETAQALGIAALGWLASDPDRIGGFLATSGIDAEALRQAAQQPDFLAGVLDHLAADESLLLAFIDHTGIKPDAVNRARHALGSLWERDVP